VRKPSIRRSDCNNLTTQFYVSLVLFALVQALGCATVRDDSFTAFAQSLTELRDGADEALNVPYQWTRERYVMETAAASADTIEGLDAVQWLILEKDAENVYAWSMIDEPLYVTQKRFRRGVYELNSTLLGYAELLNDLANEDLSVAQFDDRARELNTGIRGAAAALGDTASTEGIAIFSAAATDMIRLYLDDKKRDHLRSAIEGNQTAVEEAAVHIRSALRLTALHLWHEYDEKTFVLADPLNPYASTKFKDRYKGVGGIVEVNDVLMQQLETLRVLDQSYQALPRANRELFEWLDNPGASLRAVREIGDNGARLRRLYDELSDD
jgi:hypothetical protein